MNIGFLVIGAPLPGRQAKDRSVPYPCMDHACGCMNAEQCWRGCCCCSLEEKLAWARKHGVTPPAYVLAQIESDKCESHDMADEAAATCCASEHCSACKPCCGHAAEHKKTNGSKVQWMIGIMALKCQGQHGWIILAGVLVINLPESLPQAVQTPISEHVLLLNEASVTQTLLPAVPPPRL